MHEHTYEPDNTEAVYKYIHLQHTNQATVTFLNACNKVKLPKHEKVSANETVVTVQTTSSLIYFTGASVMTKSTKLNYITNQDNDKA